MIKIGDKIPGRPESDGNQSARDYGNFSEVVYIHPEGRFYCVEFTFPGGTFRETRYFTQAEKEEAWARGIFRRPVERFLGSPSNPQKKLPKAMALLGNDDEMESHDAKQEVNSDNIFMFI